MPSYEHICGSEDCKFEWEDFYSITTDPPTTCPQCKQETAKRLISGGSGKGIMAVSDSELSAHVQKGAQEIVNNAKRSDSYLANIIGK